MVNPNKLGGLNQFKAKKKRQTDPNAPPRPTLLGHDKTIKDMKNSNQMLEHEVRRLSREVDTMRSKMIQFQQYLDQVHTIISNQRTK